MGSEIRQMYRNYYSVIRLLVDAYFPYYKYVMDCLINIMNNKRFLSPSLSHFSLIINPSHIPYSFCSPPVLILITTKEDFVLDWIKVAEFCVDCSEVYWFVYS
jgi:hypothetical protein